MYVHEYYEIPYSTEKSNSMRWEKLKDKFLKNNMSLSICNTRLSKKNKTIVYQMVWKYQHRQTRLSNKYSWNVCGAH